MNEPEASRTILITGAAGGLASGMLPLLARSGHRLVCVDVAEAPLRQLIEQLDAVVAERAHLFACDLTDGLSVGRLAERVQAEVGPVDVVVNAAGVLDRSPFEEADRAGFDRVIAVNLTAAVDVIRAFLPGMKARGWGRVINITSIAASHGYPYASYAASKAGLRQFGRSLVSELRGSGVTVTSISPGIIDTPMVVEAVRARVRRSVPTQNLIEPAEIGALVLFLLGDAARNITGSDFVIDGGVTQLLPFFED